MKTYLILLRGINVGGKNKIPMAELRTCLEGLGYSDVSTYINSGNAIVSTIDSAAAVTEAVEQALPKCFRLDSGLIRIKTLTRSQLKDIVDKRPPGFGDQPDVYHSDVVFLMGITPKAAMAVFNPCVGVDVVTPGSGVIYSQRLSAQRTESRLSSIIGTPEYRSMTIRNWNTTTKLLALLSG